MVWFVQPILTFLIASLITSLELITSKYPRTFFLLKKSWAIYSYAFIYGLIGSIVMLGLDQLINAGIIQVSGFGLSNPWIQSITVGLTIKAFLHINLFNVTVGSQSFPVGVESIVQIFEPWLLRTIELDNFNSVRNFINPRANKYSNLEDVKKKIIADIPRTFSEQERVAFKTDIEKANNINEAMELYLNFLGKMSFERLFPL